MTTKTDGGSAFPLGANEYSGTGPEWGMSLRDYFAAKAMQAILATNTQFPDEHWRVGVAIDAYAMADAMLAAREKP